MKLAPWCHMNKNLKILVVDDHGTMRRILRSSLEELGFKNIDEADDGEQALVALSLQRFDLVITDRNMPKMDGIGLLHSIRSNPRLCHLPVLMVSAVQNKDEIYEALAAKVSGYIIKPFTTAILADKLKKILPSCKPEDANG